MFAMPKTTTPDFSDFREAHARMEMMRLKREFRKKAFEEFQARADRARSLKPRKRH